MIANRAKRRSERLVAAWCCTLAIACGKAEDPTQAQAQAHDGGGSAGESASAAGNGGAGGSNPGSAGTSSLSPSAGSAGSSGMSGSSSDASGTSGYSSGASGEAGAGGVTGPAAFVPVASYWQIGEDRNDDARDIGVDASENIYVGGTTQSALNGPLSGTFDTYVRKYDSAGNVIWTLQWGKGGYNYLRGLAVEPSGGFYVAGTTDEFSKTTHYVNKYDSSGTQLRSQETASATDVAMLDSKGNLYLVDHGIPWSGAALSLRKYDADGQVLSTWQFGTPNIESGADIAVDATDNVYVASDTMGTVENPNEGYPHGRLYKLDPSGSVLWSQQFDAPSRVAITGVAVDPSGNAYIAGYTDVALGETLGGYDAFIRKYDPNGNELWTRQFGTSLGDFLGSVRVDAQGNAYVSGSTEGPLAGPSPQHNSYSAIVRKYDPSGAVQWTTQCASTATTNLSSLAIAVSGNVYGAGIWDANALVAKLEVH